MLQQRKGYVKITQHLMNGVEEDNVIVLATFLKNKAEFVLFFIGKKVTLFFSLKKYILFDTLHRVGCAVFF
jgi:hypothetical protein